MGRSIREADHVERQGDQFSSLNDRGTSSTSSKSRRIVHDGLEDSHVSRILRFDIRHVERFSDIGDLVDLFC